MRARPCNCVAQWSTIEPLIRLDEKLVAKCKFPFCIPQVCCERKDGNFHIGKSLPFDYQLKQLQKVDKPCAGTLLVSDCRSSSSVAEYLILNVLLMVEARLRSDSNWELSWSPTKEKGVPIRVDNSDHWINHYSLDNSKGYASSYPMKKLPTTGTGCTIINTI